MRTREGKALAEDMGARIQTIRGHRTYIAARTPLLAQEMFDENEGSGREVDGIGNP